MGWKAIVVDTLRCNNRYLSFLCGLCLMTAAGTEYMFSTYAPDLKDLMEYEQTEINFVGTCTNLGIYLGFYMGILHDYTNARLTCLVGAVFLFVGWFFAYLATIDYFDSSYVLMGLFMFIQGNGCNALYTAALANNIKKFPPKYRGTVVGFLVSMFGLSSAIFSPIYVYGFQSDVQTFFLFFAILTPSIAFLGVIFLSVPPKEEIVKEIKEEESEKIEKVKTLNIIKEEVNTAKIFLRLDFWLLFFVFMLGAGVGLTIINNLGSMVESAGGTSASSLVTFLSIFNCLGRIISGLVSDVCLKYNILSRLGVLTISLALMALSQIYFVLVLSLDSVPVLYPGVAFVGLTYGALMSLSPSIATELFGQKYFGGNWSIVRISPAFSSFVMATVIAGRLYERNQVEGTNDCYGWKCYGWSISVDFFICVFTTFLCFIMAVRWFLFVKRRQKKGLLSDFSE